MADYSWVPSKLFAERRIKLDENKYIYRDWGYGGVYIVSSSEDQYYTRNNSLWEENKHKGVEEGKWVFYVNKTAFTDMLKNEK